MYKHLRTSMCYYFKARLRPSETTSRWRLEKRQRLPQLFKQGWRIIIHSSLMIFEEYRAKSSLQSGIKPLYSNSYISADSNFYRGNRKYPARKRKFSREPWNKTSEEWNKTSEEWNETSDKFFVSSLDISKSPPRNCSISLIVPSMTSF